MLPEQRSRIAQELAVEFAKRPELFEPVVRKGLGFGMHKSKRVEVIRELAAIAGCSVSHVRNCLDVERARRIGAAIRAKEEEIEKTRLKSIAPFDAEMAAAAGMASNVPFDGWGNFFLKFKMVAETYKHHARSRGDVFAEAYLKDISEACERCLNRIARDRENLKGRNQFENADPVKPPRALTP